MFSFYFCSTQIVQCSWNRRRRQWNRQQILFTCTVAHVEEERHARMFKCAHKHARTCINWCPSEAPYGWKKAKRRLECDPVQATNIFWQVFFSRLPSIWIYSKKTKKSQKIPQHNMQVYIIADFKWAKQCQMRRLSDCGESTLVHSSLHHYFCSLRFMDSPFLGSLSCFGQALAIVQMLHICLILQYIKKVCGWLSDGRI